MGFFKKSPSVEKQTPSWESSWYTQHSKALSEPPRRVRALPSHRQP